jgi:DNA-binding transcriptional regulator YiaG
MGHTIASNWKPRMHLPYVIVLGPSMLAVTLRAAWLKADPLGRPLLLPPAVRTLDRLRAVFAHQQHPTPGFIVSLREAMGLTQSQFGRRLRVSKMTVSRWECGRMRPGAGAVATIPRLQASARRAGVRVDGQRQPTKHPRPINHCQHKRFVARDP